MQDPTEAAPMTKPTVTSLIDHAAQQNFQWLFMAALVVMGCAIVWLARLIMARNKEMRDDQKYLREEFIKVSAASAALAERACEALKQSTETLNDVRVVLATLKPK